METFAPGTIIDDQYEIVSRPLMGGMGIVYLCHDHDADRPAALKTFRPELLPDRAARERFLREGDAWITLGDHPHVVRAYKAVRIGDGRLVFLALELIARPQDKEDASLRAWLTPGQPLPLAQALLFALQAARGMRHAVEKMPAFVHRDLKPENLLVGADSLPGWPLNRLRVTDFGLAQVALGTAALSTAALSTAAQDSGIGHPEAGGEEDVRRTRLTRGAMGTPLYMAPEQWLGQPVSAATDIYALGCILFEMLSGQRAAEGRSIEALQAAHVQGRLRPIPAELPAPVQALLRGCLAVEAGQRPAGWPAVEDELAAAYRACCGEPPPASPAAAPLDRAARIAAGWSYSAMGVSYLDIGKARSALPCFERARQAGRQEGEPRLESAALTLLGLAYAALGEPRRAIPFYEQALQIARQIGNRRGEGAALGNLGLAYADLGEPRRAIPCYEQALSILREIGDRRGEGAALGNLGSAYLNLGEPRRAIPCYEQRLVIAREIGDRRGEGNALGNLGNAYATLGEPRRAIPCYEQQLVITREIGDRRGEGNALGNLGVAYKNLGEPRRAIPFYEQQLVITREIGDRRGEGNALGNLGAAYYSLSEPRRAIQCYEQRLVIAREIGDRRGEGNALGNLGTAYANLGEPRRAIQCYEQQLVITREIGDMTGLASGSFNLALLYQQQGQPSQALPLAQQAAQLFAQIGHLGKTQRAQQLVAQLQGGAEAPAPSGPSPEQLLAQFDGVIRAAVDGARGLPAARQALEEAFPMLTQNGWMLEGPIRRLWQGERQPEALIQGIDPNSALIVGEILRRLDGA